MILIICGHLMCGVKIAFFRGPREHVVVQKNEEERQTAINVFDAHMLEEGAQDTLHTNVASPYCQTLTFMENDDLSLLYIHSFTYIYRGLHIFTPSVLKICSDISHKASLSSSQPHLASLCLTIQLVYNYTQ